MRRRLLGTSLAIVFASLSPVHVAGQEAAPTAEQVARLVQRQLGTWEMNVAKSKFFVEEPWRSKTVIYGPSSDPLGIEYSARTVKADGTEDKRVGTELQRLDGKTYEYFNPQLLIVRRPLDDYRVEINLIVKGYPPGLGTYARNTQEVSRDGKTLTVTTRSFTREGKEVVTVIQVFDKVAPGQAAPAGTVTSVEDHDRAMKAISTNAFAVPKLLEARAFSDVKARYVAMRELFVGVEGFWAARKKDDAAMLARNAMAKIDTIIRAADMSDRPGIDAGIKELVAACAACHTKYREPDPATPKSFVIKPGVL
jgi:cytochrome c556